MSYCAIFERNLAEAIPSSSVSLCKTLFAYSVPEANGYRHGRCLQRAFHEYSSAFFLFPSLFLPFSSPRVCLERKRSMPMDIPRISGGKTRGLIDFLPVSALSPCRSIVVALSPSFLPPAFFHRISINQGKNAGDLFGDRFARAK